MKLSNKNPEVVSPLRIANRFVQVPKEHSIGDTITFTNKNTNGPYDKWEVFKIDEYGSPHWRWVKTTDEIE